MNTVHINSTDSKDVHTVLELFCYTVHKYSHTHTHTFCVQTFEENYFYDTKVKKNKQQ